MKRLRYILLLLVPALCGAQGHINITSAYINISGGTAAHPVCVVVGNNGTAATPASIARSTGGGIISEGEYNQVWWQIGTAAAANNFIMPFYYLPSTSYIPVTLTISTAGTTAAGYVKFATYHGSTATCNSGTAIADNWCYMPSDVDNMYGQSNPPTAPSGKTTDNSYYVVDRFWVLDAYSYGAMTTEPNPTITFSYLNSTNAAAEDAAPNVAGFDATLVAQRFNSTHNYWGDYIGTSAAPTVAGTVSTLSTGASSVTAAGFYRSWTLAGSAHPLPIQLTAFSADCQNYYALLQWTTATETNNDYFTIQRTQDGINYQTIATIKGAGTSSTPHSYSYVDDSPLPGISYYRLSQTDLDGTTVIVGDIVFTPCENGETVNAFAYNGTINVQINALASGNYTLNLINLLGQTILTKNCSAVVGLNTYKLNPQVAKGIYILQIVGSQQPYSRKLELGPQ